jgi:hypothetical protein
MAHRTPQRSYTPQAIEAWFNRLSTDWEAGFSAEELAWGRHYYRTGEVRSTELMDGSAIIHFKRGKEPLYVIVDWEAQQPSFRESHPGFAPGRGLAVASLYELEEFVADEVPAVEAERAGPAEAETDPEEPAGRQPPAGGGNGSVAPLPAAQPAAPLDRAGRTLRVRLSAREDGLWLEAGWERSDRGIDWSHFSLRELTRWEREQLIGFTARAHRGGFRPGDREGCYRLLEPAGIERFFREELGQWQRRYRVEEAPELGAWKAGLQLARPVVEVRGVGGQSRFRFDFTSSLGSLPAGIRDRLLRHPGHTHFVPGVGIFRIDPAALGSVHEWKSLMPAEGEGLLPRYLLFAFARDPQVELRLGREIAQWRRELESGDADATAVALPDYLRGYQKTGVAWLRKLEAAGCHGLLADEMGLGKTLQVLHYLRAQGALGTKPVLVVCPASVVPVWVNEVERFFTGTPVRILGRNHAFDAAVPALWLASYTQLRRNKAQLEGIEFAHAILDEAQTIKNPDAKVTHACFGIRARQRLVLTGTPMENRPLDMWTLFRFLMPGLLGGRRPFEEQVKSGPEFVERLRRAIAPFILRRTKLAVATDLPPKVEFNWYCPLTPQQRRCYEELTGGAAQQFSGGLQSAMRDQRMHLFSLLTRLRQACCDPSLLPGHADHWSHSGKLVSLNSRLAEAFEGGSRVVVFSQFVQFLRRARAAVRAEHPAVPQFELTGATLDRDQPVRRFNACAGPGVFFISLRAGGTGLNLQAADYVFLLDPWWNPAVEAQAIDRVHRIGQRKRVIVYRMVTRGTIEDRIERLKQQKGELFASLLSDLEAPADLLNAFDSLQSLIALDAGED